MARSILSDRCLSCPICDIGVLWLNGWTDEDETGHAGRARPRTHCVRWTQLPHGKGHSSPTLSKFTGSGFACVRIIREPCLLWPNGWMDQDETWRGGTPWPWPHCVRWGPSSSKKGGHSPQFSAHVCCGQMAGWIKMPLGVELGLGQGDIVLDGSPAPASQRAHPANVRPMSTVAKRSPISTTVEHLC